jgi:Ca2+-binding RTX toxin-like protein
MKKGTSRGVLLLASMLVAVVLFAGVALAATINCAGGGTLCRGTTTADDIQGSSGRDSIYAYGGSDSVGGGSGADTIRGGPGRDSIWQGNLREKNTDVIYAGTGDDKVNTNNKRSYKDYAYCGKGFDTLIADPRIDRENSCERIFVR